MPTKKKSDAQGTVKQAVFDRDEFSVNYYVGNRGVDHEFEGWIIEMLNDRFPGVSCDLEMSTRIRNITFRR